MRTFPIFALFLLVTAGAWAEDWLTDKDYDRAMSAPLPMVAWDDAPLKSALMKLATSQKIAVFLDRRVDPELRLNGSYSEVTFGDLVQTAVKSGWLMDAELEASQLANVVYVGPRDFTTALRTLAANRRAEAMKLPEAGKKVWTRPETVLRWKELTVPGEMLVALAKKNRIKIQNYKSIPHDLWEAGDLPAMSLTDAFTLLLAQFDLTFEFDLKTDPKGSVVTIRPIAESDLVMTRTYPDDKSRQNKKAAIRKTFPDTVFKISNGKMEVVGTSEVHDFLKSTRPSTEGVYVGSFPQLEAARTPAGGGSKKIPEGAEIRLSGKVRGPFLPILQSFCKQQGYTLEYDPDKLQNAGIALEAPVDLDLQSLTIPQFIDEIARAGGCRATMEGKTVYLELP